MTRERIDPVQATTFATLNFTERGDLQRLLRDQIEIISKDTLVIAEEFCDWDDSRRRIDLLAIDKEARLVVIELKRTEELIHHNGQTYATCNQWGRRTEEAIREFLAVSDQHEISVNARR
jgi:RecB family endonuclease NucS